MIPCQRELFDVPDDVTYFNCAYMAPLMKTVVEAGTAGLARKVRPWEIRVDDFFDHSERLRGRAAKLFGASADDVAIVPSASYGIATAALNLPVKRGQKILILDEQFPSNSYPWWRVAEETGAEVVTVPWPEDGDWTSGVVAALRDGVAVAALPHVQWTSGGLLGLVKIGAACRKNGTALVLDLTQSLGAYPFNAAEIQPDFAVAAAYKWLLGPYTLGVMYVAPKRQNGKPLEENWIQRENARNFTDLISHTDAYMAGARRFDMGEHANFALVPAAIAAIEQILDWGVEEIAATVGGLNRSIATAVSEFGLMPWPEAHRAPHYLCLRGSVPRDLPEKLAAAKVFISLRGSSIRVTPHVYNSAADVERFVSVLRKS